MSKIKIVYVVLVILVSSFFLGCAGPTGTPTATPTATPTGTPMMTATPTVSKTPETEIPGLAPKGDVIYNYIMNMSNYKNWKMWPGTTGMHPSTAHSGAAFLTTYVNDVALATIDGKTGIMKEDSVIVKENYNANKTLVALTVMFKEDGYDSAHNDWFWAKYATNGTIQAEGKVKGCIDCHAKNSTNDYLFSGPLK